MAAGGTEQSVLADGVTQGTQRTQIVEHKCHHIKSLFVISIWEAQLQVADSAEGPGGAPAEGPGGGLPAPPWATAAEGVGPGGAAPAEGPGGSLLDYTKPRQTIQIPKRTIQRHEQLDKTQNY